MVVLHNFLDIIDSLCKTNSVTLPAIKENYLKIEYNDENNEKPVYNGSKPPLLPFAESEVFHADIIDSRRLTALDGDCKAVYEVTFNVEGSNFNFKAGDTIGVIPHNDDSDVNFLLSHLQLASKADLCYSLCTDSSVKGSKIPVHIPAKSTLRHVLRNCLDLRCILKKLFLFALSKYTKDERERKTLEYLSSKEGSIAYNTHILSKCLCLLDIFTIFKSCKPPVEVLLVNLPRLLPRPYSIVNSGLKTNKRVSICFSVMSINNRQGLTTGWLEDLIVNKELNLVNQIQNLTLSNEGAIKNKVPAYLRKNLNMFCLPERMETPIILIGPGTGVAPFIGFLEEREVLKNGNPETKLGEAWLFFGCRNPELDFIYEYELNGFLSRGILTKLSKAFSRTIDAEYKYIQDALTHYAKDVIKLINNGAKVYICGDLETMVAEIKEVFIKCFMEHENLTIEEANAKISGMQRDKRYLVDAWS